MEEMEQLALIEEGVPPAPAPIAEESMSFEAVIGPDAHPESFSVAAGPQPINDASVEAKMRLILEGKHRRSNAITLATLRRKICKLFEPPPVGLVGQGKVAKAMDNVLAKSMSQNGPFRLRDSDGRVFYEE